MSFNFFPERIDSIGQIAGTVDQDLLIPIDGIDGMRITIPHLSVSCGADDQTLHLLQVEDGDTIEAIDNDAKTVTVYALTVDLTGKLVALESVDGLWFFMTVTSCYGNIYTFSEDISDMKIDGRFLTFSEKDSQWNQRVPLKGDTETLIIDPAPGRLIARDFCYPVILSVSNDTTAVQFNSATVVYINR